MHALAWFIHATPRRCHCKTDKSPPRASAAGGQDSAVGGSGPAGEPVCRPSRPSGPGACPPPQRVNSREHVVQSYHNMSEHFTGKIGE